jgi:hypothetical protein
MSKLCVVCIRDPNIKPRPGIHPCLGCRQVFCTQHVSFHRQELANELDLVIGDRNELQDLLDHQHDLPDVSIQLDAIDEWVKNTIKQVHQAADNARQRLIKLAQEARMRIKDQCIQLSEQLKTIRENESFFEQDIDEMKEQCNYLKIALSRVKINGSTTDVFLSLAQPITLQQNELEQQTQEEEQREQQLINSLSYIENLIKLQTPYKRIKVPHNGLPYIGSKFAILENLEGGHTLINLENGFLESVPPGNSQVKVLCWSSYLDAFLCTDSTTPGAMMYLRHLSHSTDNS